MTNYVGLDVSQKTTTLCIVDGEGHRQWRGECVTSPEQIVQAVSLRRAFSLGFPAGAIVVFIHWRGQPRWRGEAIMGKQGDC